jgi:choline dehydrogenase-like flavoprotein
MSIQGHEAARGETDLQADVVIVGTGPGGAAAGRVLAMAGKRVIFLEEGPAQSRFRPNQGNVMRYHMQEQGAMVALGLATVTVAAGRGVGGGSLINSAMSWRTPNYVLEGWVELLGQDQRFGPAAMAPIFDELFTLLQIAQTPEDLAGENNLMIVRGARSLGLKSGLIDRNTPGCVACGMCNFGCPSGGKASVDKNLIAEAVALGALVQADTRVDRLLIEGDRAVGVRGVVRHPETREVVGDLTVRADKVLLCAGAIGTPRLLHQSGVADRLGDRVGKGLHLHPGNAVIGLCDHIVDLWKGATQAAYFEDPNLPGVLPHTLSLPPEAMLLALGDVGLPAKANVEIMRRLCGCLVMVSDKGEGSVGVKSDGSADIYYEFADIDLHNMREGLKRTCEVLLAGGAKRLLVPVAGAGWVDDLAAAHAVIDAADLTDYRLLYAAHPMATCRMGLDPATSVVAPSGEAHRLPGLYIADASVFPTALGVNPQITVMALATVIGRHMAEHW